MERTTNAGLRLNPTVTVDVELLPASLTTGPWVRPIAEAADQLGIELDIYTALATSACGFRWMRAGQTQIGRRDAITVHQWVADTGMLAVLQSHGPGDPGARPAPRSQADIDRVARLITANRELLDGRSGKWLLGDVMRLMWDSKATLRVLSERGIAVGDVREAIERALGPDTRLGTGKVFIGTVINELKRMHRGRLAFLFVDEQAGTARLVARESHHQQAKDSPRQAQVDLPAEHEVGQIVWVAVEETTNGRKSRKRHPAVLLARTGRNNAKWLVLTMTTEAPGNPDFRRVPQPEALGLEYGGFVWNEVQKVHKAQVERSVGWIHRPLLSVIDRTIDIRQPLLEELRRIADEHHGRG